MRTYIILDDLKISDNSVNSAVLAVKFIIEFLVYLIFYHFCLRFFLFLFFCFCFFISLGVIRYMFSNMVKKHHQYATVVLFLTCCISLQACADNLRCKHVRSVYGTMLRGHVFQEHNASNILTCGQLCNSNLRCQSVNYVVSRQLCELNSRTKEARPEDYLQDADRVYLTKPRERGIEFTIV